VSVTASVTLDIGGGSYRTVGTVVDTDEIRRVGVAASTPVRSALANRADAIGIFGCLINVHAACLQQSLYDDAIGALRLARRSAIVADTAIRAMIEDHLRAAPTSEPRGTLRVISAQETPDEFCSLLGVRETFKTVYHPGAPYGGLLGVDRREMYRPDPTIDNVSFLIAEGTRVLAVVPMLVHDDHIGGWVRWVPSMGCMPATVYFIGDAPRKRVLKAVLNAIEGIMRRSGCLEVVIEEPLPSDPILYRLLMGEFEYSAELWDRAVVDLRRSESDIFADVRKSYKSHINWCRANLRTETFSGDRIDDAIQAKTYEVIQLCHRDLIARFGDGMTAELFSGPVTMARWGHGEIALHSAPNGVYCGVSVTTGQGGIAYYSLAGSAPIDGKNPGSFVVYDSIMRAKERGMREYHVSRLFAPSRSIVKDEIRRRSQREVDVEFFKRGFSDRVDIGYVYRMRLFAK
jgi:hypothetical protein